MKDFQKTDWKQYNRPPFYQQWLCRDDTLKLASFGDKGLSEADGQILALKDQWDLDNAKGRFLDRIGKLLDEKRNGNTDEHYRILLKLRSLLNTNDGSIPSIIEAVKFFYSSEIVHIVPDYPAGLIIEHDGEGTPGLNFNRLLAEIIPAGVSFSTKELFDFLEEMACADNQFIQVHHNPKEEFEGRIYHNRRILHDGHTILPAELRKAFHNDTNYHNGDTSYNGQYEAEAAGFIKLPVRRQSGYFDPLSLDFGLAMRDFQFSRSFHNGGVRRKMRAKHNGEFTRNGVTNRMPIARHNRRSQYSISDAISAFKLNQPVIDNFPSNENALVNLTAYDTGQFRKPYNHDGTYRYNSALYHSGRALDFLALLQRLFIQETAMGMLYHNRIIRHDGSEKHSGLGHIFAYEKQLFNTGIPVAENMPVTESQILCLENKNAEVVSKDYKHNRAYTHNGFILRNSLINDKMTMKMEFSPIIDNAAGIPRHNKSIIRDGSERHSFTGTQAAYEAFKINMKDDYIEAAETSETQTLVFDHAQADVFTHDYRYNKVRRHDGTAYHHGIINDTNKMDFTLAPMEDTHLGRLLHNGSIRRNGEERHQGQRIAYDIFTIGIRYHHFHNGDYFRNNGIKHNAGTLIPLEDVA
jgi:hypothetical protein